VGVAVGVGVDVEVAVAVAVDVGVAVFDGDGLGLAVAGKRLGVDDEVIFSRATPTGSSRQPASSIRKKRASMSRCMNRNVIRTSHSRTSNNHDSFNFFGRQLCLQVILVYYPMVKVSCMLDFSPVRQKEITIAQLAAGISHKDLRSLTNEMVDWMLAMITGCVDEDVILVPDDPEAYDPAAATAEELQLSWTLGHVIVHTTASAEEAAFLAAELARGVPRRQGRSRYEVHWTTITTINQCRRRLEESRRLRLATLDVWPPEPFLDNAYMLAPGGPAINAIGQFLFGLMHDDSHLEQIADIVRQAVAARTP